MFSHCDYPNLRFYQLPHDHPGWKSSNLPEMDFRISIPFAGDGRNNIDIACFHSP
jgi:hypothetical protein